MFKFWMNDPERDKYLAFSKVNCKKTFIFAAILGHESRTIVTPPAR
jgi:hypothetical protein